MPAKRHHSLLLIMLLFLSCNPEKPPARKAFYYWKSTVKFTPAQETLLDSLNIRRMYVKFFDVEWQSGAVQARPVAEVHFMEWPRHVELVPVVFITNQTMQHIQDSALSTLARHINQKVEELLPDTLYINELQIDCDWSQSTRDKYFRLLKDLKSLDNSRQLTATIRLHQVKYFRRTGVPPVSRGMLMFYNMGEIGNINTTNSIFNVKDAEKYLINFDEYPLKLDVVLPIFSWVVDFRRGKVNTVFPELRPAVLDTMQGLKKIAPGRYEVEQRVFVQENALPAGDVLRMEDVTPGKALEAAQLIKPYLRSRKLTVALYHFDPQILKRYDAQKLDKIFAVFN